MLDEFAYLIVRIRHRDLHPIWFPAGQGFCKLESLRRLDFCWHWRCELVDHCFDEGGALMIKDVIQLGTAGCRVVESEWLRSPPRERS